MILVSRLILNYQYVIRLWAVSLFGLTLCFLISGQNGPAALQRAVGPPTEARSALLLASVWQLQVASFFFLIADKKNSKSVLFSSSWNCCDMGRNTKNRAATGRQMVCCVKSLCQPNVVHQHQQVFAKRSSMRRNGRNLMWREGFLCPYWSCAVIDNGWMLCRLAT